MPFKFARGKGSRSTVVLWIFLILVSCSLKNGQQEGRTDGSIDISACFENMRIWVQILITHRKSPTLLCVPVTLALSVSETGVSAGLPGLTPGSVRDLCPESKVGKGRGRQFTYFVFVCSWVFVPVYTCAYITHTHTNKKWQRVKFSAA